MWSAMFYTPESARERVGKYEYAESVCPGGFADCRAPAKEPNAVQGRSLCRFSRPRDAGPGFVDRGLQERRPRQWRLRPRAERPRHHRSQPNSRSPTPTASQSARLPGRPDRHPGPQPPASAQFHSPTRQRRLDLCGQVRRYCAAYCQSSRNDSSGTPGGQQPDKRPTRSRHEAQSTGQARMTPASALRNHGIKGPEPAS